MTRPAEPGVPPPPEVLRALGNDAGGLSAAEAPSPRPTGWRAGPRTLRLATLVGVAALLAVATGRPWLLALAAGPLCLLVLSASGGPRPEEVQAVADVPARRCFVGEQIDVTVTAAFDGAVGWIDPGVSPGPGCELVSLRTAGAVVTLGFTAARWGRWSLGVVDLDLYDEGGLSRRTVRVDLGEVEVFPLPVDGAFTPIPVRLPDRLGEHTARQTGEGIEVIGVRPHVWGERQRRIHWAATTRRGSIQINQFAAERAADAVVLLDSFADIADPATGRSSLDESLRVAAGLIRTYLRSHDRVGIVSVGGKLNWLQPGSGDAHFYRLVQTVLDVRRDLAFHTPDLNRLPPPAIPNSALVYAVTPLADGRVMDVLGGLAERGNPVVVVEVPVGDPRVEEDDAVGQLALRLWRLDREALRYSLVERGIPVVPWQGETLDLSLAPLLRTRIQGRAG
ncbi:DUF58 domain-containing protein [Streptacidiphilus sp. PB12-B1b]|uniref:DUF58 domain-containing protein n=1 Tax=Streptacidiphilus sp. PB12-B1b TaxID=2705012 RepID=UPI0015FD563A|nr:DUF58 domain-containing protein [Streptacidiphilus sp. PB12-B1b]QMU75779.1 DUF58 domain-containing protein [Streptacidiphilus sp. PB12-B1b]